MAVLLAMRLPQLANHVSHVVVERAERQMVRVDAFPVVAGMQDEQAISDWPILELIRHAVGVRRLAILADLPIAVWHDASRPFVTTGFDYLDLLLETVRNWSFCSHVWPRISARLGLRLTASR